MFIIHSGKMFKKCQMSTRIYRNCLVQDHTNDGQKYLLDVFIRKYVLTTCAVTETIEMAKECDFAKKLEPEKKFHIQKNNFEKINFKS